MTEWKTPRQACLNCGYVVDAASNSPLETEPAAPTEGDATVCIECSHIMIFKADGTVRNATPAEMNAVANDPDVLKLLTAMGALRRTKLWRRRHEVLPGAAGLGGVVRKADGSPVGEHVPQDRDPKGRAE
jgi:hypothetical protein